MLEIRVLMHGAVRRLPVVGGLGAPPLAAALSSLLTAAHPEEGRAPRRAYRLNPLQFSSVWRFRARNTFRIAVNNIF